MFLPYSFKCPVVYNDLQEAEKAGYILTGEYTKQCGYVTRAGDPLYSRPVYRAGKGKRAGQLFVLVPSYQKTINCFRAWLKKGGAENE